jgi:hypothetical protein
MISASLMRMMIQGAALLAASQAVAPPPVRLIRNKNKKHAVPRKSDRSRKKHLLKGIRP